jgi:hypothetical protein
MQTRETNRDKWVSISLIIAALLAGLSAVAAQQPGGAAVSAPPPVPVPTVADAPLSVPLTPQTPRTPPALATAPRPHVDMVFALDTTGSMADLIAGAKRKIWSVASFVSRAQPTPELRVGLVAYRDIGDAYVTRVHDLDGDLDRVYRRLLALRADGGGDGPEHVARALHEAVHRMSWSNPDQPTDAATVRLIYLVGDAPPHVDYHDGYDFAQAARDAAQRGIAVHAIRCGTDPETATYWRRIAKLGRGEFLTIDQSGGMHDRRTPFDEELARLHDQLSDTVIPYGRRAAETRASLHAAAAATTAVKAERAGYLAAKKAVSDDLIEELKSGKADLDRLNEAELPPSLAALPRAAREEKLVEKAHARGQLLEQIAKLSDRRDGYLKGHPDAAPAGLDAQVEKTVRKAGAAAGLAF